MVSHRLRNYLRTFRKRAALSQREMAYLLGTRSGTKVSRYECFARVPALRTVFAYEVVFRTHARELFAGLYENAQRSILKRVRLLQRRLNAQPASPLNSHKLNSLAAIFAEPNAGSRKTP